ncbi:hypothetical protein POM88_047683 [Heracleum sosnowskyi]|uniref:EF-hand domain-containing protein n=1 Tax=Heracleum sosnowskyi TaxID=360622 RepID=A0AAD8GSM2_9APIA|nr:hypothetical protein POM88_047683 [Heracleum sosnowskyi]
MTVIIKYHLHAELRVLVIRIKLEDDEFVRGEYAEEVREAFDVDGDTYINEDEFGKGLTKFFLDAQQSVNQNVMQVPNTEVLSTADMRFLRSIKLAIAKRPRDVIHETDKMAVAKKP